MFARAYRGGLWLTVVLSCSCDFDILPVVIDAGVPLDLATVPDLTGYDGLVCPTGRLPHHVGELTEGDASRWAAEALTPYAVSPPTTTASVDSARTRVGDASIRMETLNDRAALIYPLTRDAGWNLLAYARLSLFVSADNQGAERDPGWQGKHPRILLVSTPIDYFEYVPEQNWLHRTPEPWVHLEVPIAGGSGWTRNVWGTPSLSNVNYVAITADTWGNGFTLWVDGLTFAPGLFLDCSP